MLRNAKDLHGCSIRATDGEIGTIDQFYFDDDTWTIRYLTANTGNWLAGRLVLISPFSVAGRPDWGEMRINVALTKEQVRNSPDLNAHLPVSRQNEIAYLGYYGYPFYWGSSDFSGPLASPVGLMEAEPPSLGAPLEFRGEASGDSHLRSAQELTGYDIDSADGEIGHLDGFVFDDETWAIHYIEVATRNWWPGKKVLVAPSWIERMSWEDSKVYVKLTREAIQSAPEYLEYEPISREYEARLYFHYGKPPYWPET